MMYHSPPPNNQRRGLNRGHTPPHAPQHEYEATAAYVDTSSMSYYQNDYDDYDYDDQGYEYEGYYDEYVNRPEQTYSLESPHMRMVFVMSVVVCIIVMSLLAFWFLSRDGRAIPTNNLTNNTANISQPVSAEGANVAQPNSVTTSQIAPFFAPSVQYWEPQILVWANTHNLDPNLVATVMQIESCGHPEAVSSAGAQGLFQVMPFHFAAGENMRDPETNAFRGVAYLAEMMRTFNNDTGLAMAGYNGGPGNASKVQSQWPAETQRYYRWGTGIYADTLAGSPTSATLNRWMEAGGASLCAQAAAQIGLQ